MRTLSAVVPVWNEERFIIPHIKMLEKQVDEIIVVLGDRPLAPYKREHAYSDIPDRSEELIRSTFQSIPIFNYTTIDEDGSMMFSNIWNFGRTKVGTDMALKLDCDMFFTQKDLATFIQFIRESKYKNIAIAWELDSINYYLDLDHGLKDQVETDTLVFDPAYELKNSLDYPHEKFIADLGITLHHCRGFNKPLVTQEWIDGLCAFPSGVTSTNLVKEYGNEDKWFVAPQEIKNLLRGGKL